jgi:16S rRNA (adenine1518-N6/adenine1519-N6)-dimethyltransferase
VRIVYLVQREVADRLGAAPGTSEYGALTVGVRAVAKVERLFTVPAGAFVPRPRVDSAVIRLTPLEVPLIPDADTAAFRRFVVAIFGARRKQLVRGLRTALGLDPAGAARALQAAGVDPAARPETLSPEAFVRLFHAVVDEDGGRA